MDDLLEAVRIALPDDATQESRNEGVAACRTLLERLIWKKGTPVLDVPSVERADPIPPPSAANPAALDATGIAALVAAFSKLPAEQRLEFAISQLGALLPPEATKAMPRDAANPTRLGPLRFTLVPVHHLEHIKGRTK